MAALHVAVKHAQHLACTASWQAPTAVVLTGNRERGSTYRALASTLYPAPSSGCLRQPAPSVHGELQYVQPHFELTALWRWGKLLP
jgi:hypothetical protein